MLGHPLSVRYRIYQAKLTFVHHLVSLDKLSLSSEIFTLQREFDIPGFLLPNIIDKQINLTRLRWKQMVRKAVYGGDEKELMSQIMVSSKLNDGPRSITNLKKWNI